jgi:hypothetical protein
MFILAIVLIDVLAGQDQHAATARARVVHRLARLRRDQTAHHPDYGAGRIRLAALLSTLIGELLEQVLVGGAEHVGKLEVLVAQPVTGEVPDQLAQPAVSEGYVSDGEVEVDVAGNAVQFFVVAPLDGP